jgi:hypothetical protein
VVALPGLDVVLLDLGGVAEAFRGTLPEVLQELRGVVDLARLPPLDAQRAGALAENAQRIGRDAGRPAFAGQHVGERAERAVHGGAVRRERDEQRKLALGQIDPDAHPVAGVQGARQHAAGGGDPFHLPVGPAQREIEQQEEMAAGGRRGRRRRLLRDVRNSPALVLQIDRLRRHDRQRLAVLQDREIAGLKPKNRLAAPRHLDRDLHDGDGDFRRVAGDRLRAGGRCGAGRGGEEEQDQDEGENGALRGAMSGQASLLVEGAFCALRGRLAEDMPGLRAGGEGEAFVPGRLRVRPLRRTWRPLVFFPHSFGGERCPGRRLASR